MLADMKLSGIYSALHNATTSPDGNGGERPNLSADLGMN